MVKFLGGKGKGTISQIKRKMKRGPDSTRLPWNVLKRIAGSVGSIRVSKNKGVLHKSEVQADQWLQSVLRRASAFASSRNSQAINLRDVRESLAHHNANLLISEGQKQFSGRTKKIQKRQPSPPPKKIMTKEQMKKRQDRERKKLDKSPLR